MLRGGAARRAWSALSATLHTAAPHGQQNVRMLHCHTAGVSGGVVSAPQLAQGEASTVARRLAALLMPARSLATSRGEAEGSTTKERKTRKRTDAATKSYKRAGKSAESAAKDAQAAVREGAKAAQQGVEAVFADAGEGGGGNATGGAAAAEHEPRRSSEEPSRRRGETSAGTSASHASKSSSKGAPPRSRILVFGGSGFVGAYVCQEALRRGFEVSSLSRSGSPQRGAPWEREVEWIRADALRPDSYAGILDSVQSAVSCMGCIGTPRMMLRTNGEANVSAVRACSAANVERFVFVSAKRYYFLESAGPMSAYFVGKRKAEREIAALFPHSSVILRPGLIHGSRYVGPFKIPTKMVGAPIEMVTSLPQVEALSHLPFLDVILARPLSASKVAKVAIQAALGEENRPILEIEDIARR